MNKGLKEMKDFAIEEEEYVYLAECWGCKGPGVGMCSVHSGKTKEAGVAGESEPGKRSQRGDQK